MTRSPLTTPLRLSTLANRQTSRCRSVYVSTRCSPGVLNPAGSPSQINAALLRRGPEMPVETIVGEVDFAADKPFRERFVPFQDLGPRFEPVQFFLRHARPKFLRREDRLLVEFVVLGERFDVGLLGKLRRRFELAAFLLERS